MGEARKRLVEKIERKRDNMDRMSPSALLTTASRWTPDGRMKCCSTKDIRQCHGEEQ